VRLAGDALQTVVPAADRVLADTRLPAAHLDM